MLQGRGEDPWTAASLFVEAFCNKCFHLAKHGGTLPSRPDNRLRRGVFRRVEEVTAAIDDYIDRHNENPKPFIWTAKAACRHPRESQARPSRPS